MYQNLEELQKLSKENLDHATKSYAALTKGTQAIMVEVADYSKKAFDDSSAMMEKLAGVKTIDKVVETFGEYSKSAYETYVARATRIGELYANLAKESYKPLETAFAKAAK